jgi:hypothetical protein
VATKSVEPRRLSDDDLRRVLELAKGVDSIELKVTIPSTSHRATIQGLPLDPVEAQPRQVFFFDTPELALDKAGLIVRARRRQGGRGDTVIKLRPVEPDDLDEEMRRLPTFNVEIDIIPGGFVCSASAKGRATNQEIRDAVDGTVPLRKIFNKDQRSFFDAHAPAGIGFDSLVPLGPTFLLKAEFSGDGRLYVAEVWLYPDGSRILELSTKCATNEMFQVAAEARAFLSGRGIQAGAGVQQTKTRAALDYYSKALLAETGTKA